VVFNGWEHQDGALQLLPPVRIVSFYCGVCSNYNIIGNFHDVMDRVRQPIGSINLGPTTESHISTKHNLFY